MHVEKNGTVFKIKKIKIQFNNLFNKKIFLIHQFKIDRIKHQQDQLPINMIFLNQVFKVIKIFILT